MNTILGYCYLKKTTYGSLINIKFETSENIIFILKGCVPVQKKSTDFAESENLTFNDFGEELWSKHITYSIVS